MRINKNYLTRAIWRTRMPYQVFGSLETDLWFGVGRDYKPLDAPYRVVEQYPHYQYFGGSNASKNPPLGENVWFRYNLPFAEGEVYTVFYLYDDGCKPWETAADRASYFEKHNLIFTLEDRIELLKLLPKRYLGLTSTDRARIETDISVFEEGE